MKNTDLPSRYKWYTVLYFLCELLRFDSIPVLGHLYDTCSTGTYRYRWNVILNEREEMTKQEGVQFLLNRLVQYAFRYR